MYKANMILAGIVAVGLSSFSTLSTADVVGLSAGFKFGQTVVSSEGDSPGVTTESDAAFGMNVGYAITPQWSAEFEFIKGGAEIAGPGGSLDVGTQSIAAYATYRSPGQLYLVGKIGLVKVDFTESRFGDSSESGLSYGFGGGYRLSESLGIELDYTVVEEDMDWMLLSARYHF